MIQRMECRTGARKEPFLLQMPRVSGNAHIGNSPERFARNSRDLDTVAVLRFHVRDQSLQRGPQRRLLVKSKDGRLDLARHEEKGPSFFVNRLFEYGPSTVDGGPSF